LDDTSSTEPPREALSLRKLVQLKAGQDVRRCRDCAKCNARINEQHLIDSMDISLETLVQMVLRINEQHLIDSMDISLQTLVQMVLWNDEEVLTSRTLWSPEVYDALLHACIQGLNLQSVVTTLREEASKRSQNE
jgi:hypothetical protein